jgi:D-threitol dehydrogenase (NAD+)
VVSLSFSLEGRTAIVTGGASGIGAAIATAYVERGATVAVVDRNLEAATARAEALGANAFAVACDVTDPAATKTAVAEVVARTGRVDVLVNSAGLALLGEAESIEFDVWQTTLAVNLTGTFLMCQAAA